MSRRGGLLLAVLLVVGTTAVLPLVGRDGAGGADELDPLAPSPAEVAIGVAWVLLVLVLAYLVVRLLTRRRQSSRQT